MDCDNSGVFSKGTKNSLHLLLCHTSVTWLNVKICGSKELLFPGGCSCIWIIQRLILHPPLPERSQITHFPPVLRSPLTHYTSLNKFGDRNLLASPNQILTQRHQRWSSDCVIFWLLTFLIPEGRGGDSSIGGPRPPVPVLLPGFGWPRDEHAGPLHLTPVEWRVEDWRWGYCLRCLSGALLKEIAKNNPTRMGKNCV